MESMEKKELTKYFNKQELLPAIIQEAETGEVLMLAYMNEVSLEKTIETGYTWFYSRSRERLWQKGEESGHVQKVVSITGDCDDDTLLIKVNQTGPACHTNHYSCFFEQLSGTEKNTTSGIIEELFSVICDRKEHPKEGSYTNYLFEKGVDKILKKVGEESAEVIIAAKNPDLSELQYESADLIYHLLVLLCERGLSPENIFSELANRR